MLTSGVSVGLREIFVLIFCTIGAQSHMQCFFKMFIQVSLRGKAQVCCNITVGIFGINQHILGKLDFFAKNVLENGGSLTFFEKIRKIIRIEAKMIGNFCDGEFFVEMREQVFFAGRMVDYSSSRSIPESYISPFTASDSHCAIVTPV